MDDGLTRWSQRFYGSLPPLLFLFPPFPFPPPLLPLFPFSPPFSSFPSAPPFPFSFLPPFLFFLLLFLFLVLFLLFLLLLFPPSLFPTAGGGRPGLITGYHKSSSLRSTDRIPVPIKIIRLGRPNLRWTVVIVALTISNLRACGCRRVG